MKKFLFLLISVFCFHFSFEANAAKTINIYHFLSNNSTSVYEDENIIVRFTTTDYGWDRSKRRGYIQLQLFNKTDKILYLDKANSFSYYNGIPTRLFTNATYSSGVINGQGAAVNLGGIANAVGANNTITNVLSGITVASNSEMHNSTTYTEERILTIAPNASYIIASWDIINIDLGKPYKAGRKYTYSELNTPATYAAALKYCSSENLEDIKSVTMSTYLETVVYEHSYKQAQKYGTPNIQPYKNNVGYYSFRQGHRGWILLYCVLAVVGLGYACTL